MGTFRRQPMFGRHTVLVAGLAVAGFAALRVATGHYGLWFDEYATLIFADQPVSRLWSGWMVRETNPPLFYTMVRGWQALGWHGTDQLRWLPELGGVLGLLLLAATAGLGWGPRAVVPAVVLAGLSAQHVHTSQLLRGYIFAADSVTLALAGLLLALRADEESRPAARGPGWILYGAGSALAVHFHTTMVLWPIVATLALPLAVERPGRWSMIRAIMLADGAIVLACSWWLWITLEQIRGHSGNIAWIPRLSVRDYAWTVSQSVLLVREAVGGDHRLSKVVALAVALAALFTLRRPATRLVLACAVLGIALQGLAGLVQPITTQATLFWLSTFVVLLLAGGIAALPSPGVAAVSLMALAALLGFNLVRSLPAQREGDFARALQVVARQPQAALLVEHEAMGAVIAKACALAWPGRPCPVTVVTLTSPLPNDAWARGLGPSPVSPQAVRAALGPVTRVFTLRSAGYDPALRFGLLAPPASGDPRRPYLEGPFPAARFTAQAWRRPDPAGSS